MKYEIEMDAIPQGRARYWKGRVVDTVKSRKYKTELRAQLSLKKGEGEVKTGAVQVKIKVYRKFKTSTNARYGDIDNIAKSILDACNGILWVDDRQVVSLEIEKCISEKARMEIEVLQR